MVSRGARLYSRKRLKDTMKSTYMREKFTEIYRNKYFFMAMSLKIIGITGLHHFSASSFVGNQKGTRTEQMYVWCNKFSANRVDVGMAVSKISRGFM